MATPTLSLEVARETVDAVRRNGTVKGAAREMNIPRSTMESRYIRALSILGEEDHRAPNALGPVKWAGDAECGLTLTHEAPDCVAVAFSDAHWTTLTQPRSLAHEALLAALPEIKPDMLLSVGDLMDMGEPSRHAPLMWETRPRVKEELDAAKRHLSDIAALAPKAARYWVRGNHDDRFDKWLSLNASAFADVAGFALADHFSDWRMCWRLDLNGATVMHRYHGGVHAGWNNAIKAGVTTITGDTHALECRPFVDLRGRRYGVQVGMLGDPAWPCFRYRMATPGLWTPGFAVLTWRNGHLLPPELCEVSAGTAWFRGKAIAGKPRVRVKAA